MPQVDCGFVALTGATYLPEQWNGGWSRALGAFTFSVAMVLTPMPFELRECARSSGYFNRQGKPEATLS